MLTYIGGNFSLGYLCRHAKVWHVERRVVHMEKQRKPFLFTLRKHKKKSIFFAAVGLYGANFAVKQFR